MKLEAFKKIIITGIGGSGAYYIAKFLLFLEKEVSGSDINMSKRTQELEKLGATIEYKNPTEPYPLDTSLVIYSQAMPREFLEKLEKDNPTILLKEVGEFTAELINLFKTEKLTKSEKDAFIKSDISPLFALDQSKMKYIGITGTDGKTSTSTMIYHILTGLGFKPGLISTVSAKIGDKELDTGFHTTTPTPQELNKFIKMMEEADCTHAIIETTSHGLAMGRLAGLTFDAVAYTNISSEHIDYHKTWDNYFTAKARLISKHSTPSTKIILNKNDSSIFQKLSAICLKNKFSFKTYGTKDSPDYIATDVKEDPNISFVLNQVVFKLPILGGYNVYNALASISIVNELEEIKLTEIAKQLESFETVEGRMQVIQKKPFLVIIDFAHTAFALESALKTMHSINKNNGRVILVFGAAGKRDDSKRIPMGEVAGTFADITIITAEDPRSESLEKINDEIEKGWRKSADIEKQTLIRFDDDTQNIKVRRDAITMALKLAQNNDIVLIAGKAHEQSLCFGNQEFEWNDIKETTKLLLK